jgi:hypothetical protein
LVAYGLRLARTHDDSRVSTTFRTADAVVKNWSRSLWSCWRWADTDGRSPPGVGSWPDPRRPVRWPSHLSSSCTPWRRRSPELVNDRIEAQPGDSVAALRCFVSCGRLPPARPPARSRLRPMAQPRRYAPVPLARGLRRARVCFEHAIFYTEEVKYNGETLRPTKRAEVPQGPFIACSRRRPQGHLRCGTDR